MNHNISIKKNVIVINDIECLSIESPGVYDICVGYYDNILENVCNMLSEKNIHEVIKNLTTATNCKSILNLMTLMAAYDIDETN